MTKTSRCVVMMLSDLDIAITRSINSGTGQLPLIDHLMVWTTTIGVPLLIMAVALQWWQGNDRPQTRHVLVAAGFSFLLGLALNQPLLLFVHRVRPYDAGITHLLIERSGDFSFPSDQQTATLETEFCGQRLSTARTVNEPPRPWSRLRRPTAGAASRGKVALF
jgi:hypothetical protein